VSPAKNFTGQDVIILVTKEVAKFSKHNNTPPLLNGGQFENLTAI
jgi:hypothetical protein